MMKKLRLAAVLIIFLLGILSIHTVFITDNSQAYGYEEITTDQNWSTDRIISSSIVIKEGVTVVVKKGVTLTFDKSDIFIYGTLVLSGTAKEPIFLKKVDGRNFYSIFVYSSGDLEMRNVDMTNAGGAMLQARNPFINVAEAAYYQGGIQVYGGTLNAGGCNFHDNDSVIYVSSEKPEKVSVNRSKFINNSNYDVEFGNYDKSKSVNFKYNWWGDSNGPSRTCEGQSCYFDKMQGNIDYADWLKVNHFMIPSS